MATHESMATKLGHRTTSFLRQSKAIERNATIVPVIRDQCIIEVLELSSGLGNRQEENI